MERAPSIESEPGTSTRIQYSAATDLTRIPPSRIRPSVLTPRFASLRYTQAMGILHLGALAPDFTGLAHTGQQVRLEDYRGKNVVLWFYPKADTPG